MLSAFSDVKPYVKVASTNKVRFDTAVNKLHYRATTTFLLICCILVVINDYIGKTIECISKAIPGSAMPAVTTYCWISSTYTLPTEHDKQTGVQVAQPGVGPGQPGEEKMYHAYYQWVPFMLLFQAILFYIPHYVWKFMEDKILVKLISGMVEPSPEGRKKDRNDDSEFGDPDFKLPEGQTNAERAPAIEKIFDPVTDQGKKIYTIGSYLKRSMNQHKMLYVKFVLCELLSFIMVIVNIVLTDTFLGGTFSTYGTEVLNFVNTEDEFRTDPMIKIFPRLTKCDWHQYGPSGTIQKADVLCVLAINIINEKIYVFLWFWFIILAVLTGLQLIRRVFEIVSMPYRVSQLKRASRSRREDRCIQVISAYMDVGDWFILREARQRMLPDYYKKLLCSIEQQLDGSSVDSAPGKAGIYANPWANLRKRFNGAGKSGEGYTV